MSCVGQSVVYAHACADMLLCFYMSGILTLPKCTLFKEREPIDEMFMFVSVMP